MSGLSFAQDELTRIKMWKKGQSQRILLRTCREIVYFIVPFWGKRGKRNIGSTYCSHIWQFLLPRARNIITLSVLLHMHAHSRAFSLNGNVECRDTRAWRLFQRAKMWIAFVLHAILSERSGWYAWRMHRDNKIQFFLTLFFTYRKKVIFIHNLRY